MQSIEVIEAQFADTGQNQLEMVLNRFLYYILLIYISSHVKKIVNSTTL